MNSKRQSDTRGKTHADVIACLACLDYHEKY